jgi:hypothetical protein
MALTNTPNYTAFRYDQKGGDVMKEAASNRFHVPYQRWTQHVPTFSSLPPDKQSEKVHYWIPRRLAYHAKFTSKLGWSS